MNNQLEKFDEIPEIPNQVLQLTFPNQKDSMVFIVSLAVGFAVVGWIFFSFVSAIFGILLVLVALWLLYHVIEQHFQPNVYTFSFDRFNHIITKERKRYLGEIDEVILEKDDPVVYFKVTIDGREQELFVFVLEAQKKLALDLALQVCAYYNLELTQIDDD